MTRRLTAEQGASLVQKVRILPRNIRLLDQMATSSDYGVQQGPLEQSTECRGWIAEFSDVS